MGNATILYYVTEEFITGNKKSITVRFWQKMKLRSYVTEKEELTVITVMIPNLSKGWKQEKLLCLMREAAAEHSMNSERLEVVIHPDVCQMLMQPDRFSPVFWHLSAGILREQFPVSPNFNTSSQTCPGSVVLLLGDMFFPEEQMEKFLEMMSPYLPYMNHLTVLYKADEDTDPGQEQSRWEETIGGFAEALYYEYGLVSQIYGDRVFFEKRRNTRNEGDRMLFLDYGYPGNIPLRMLQTKDTYLDVVSSPKKEILFRRKFTEFSYLSPRKYLDTMIKSEYDK